MTDKELKNFIKAHLDKANIQPEIAAKIAKNAKASVALDILTISNSCNDTEFRTKVVAYCSKLVGLGK